MSVRRVYTCVGCGKEIGIYVPEGYPGTEQFTCMDCLEEALRDLPESHHGVQDEAEDDALEERPDLDEIDPIDDPWERL